eukprot:5891302-Pyramimonas_sp.AAC.1
MTVRSTRFDLGPGQLDPIRFHCSDDPKRPGGCAALLCIWMRSITFDHNSRAGVARSDARSDPIRFPDPIFADSAIAAGARAPPL